MQTSTRSAIAVYGRLPVAVRSLRELAAVGEVGVPVRRRARVAHHLEAGRGVDRRVLLGGDDEEGGERHRGGRLPDQHGRVRGAEAVDADRDALVERQVEELAAARERAGLELGQERGLERVEADQRIVVEQQRVGLHGARLGVRARDRLRVDLVAEVRAVALRPGISVSANACSVASARCRSPRAAGSTAARIRSAAGSADSTRPPSPSAVARCRTWRRDRRSPTGLRRLPVDLLMELLQARRSSPESAPGRLMRRAALHEDAPIRNLWLNTRLQMR